MTIDPDDAEAWGKVWAEWEALQLLALQRLSMQRDLDYKGINEHDVLRHIGAPDLRMLTKPTWPTTPYAAQQGHLETVLNIVDRHHDRLIGWQKDQEVQAQRRAKEAAARRMGREAIDEVAKAAAERVAAKTGRKKK